jgi:hypothetical protein
MTFDIHDDDLKLADILNYTKHRNDVDVYKGTIQIKSRDALDILFDLEIIDEGHRNAGLDIRILRDCSLGGLSGRAYFSQSLSAPKEVDPFTVYTRVSRDLSKEVYRLNHINNHNTKWKRLVSIVFDNHIMPSITEERYGIEECFERLCFYLDLHTKSSV